MMREHPNIASAMYSAQLIDEGIMRAWIVSMGRRSSTERAAHLMCELYLRARSADLTGQDEFALPLSQLVLADSLGMTAVHINRVLKELRLSGAMALKRGSVTILIRRNSSRLLASTRTICIGGSGRRPESRLQTRRRSCSPLRHRRTVNRIWIAATSWLAAPRRDFCPSTRG